MASNTARKPPSAYSKGAGLPNKKFNNIIKLHLIRDNFNVETWLLMGASLQALLVLVLPFSIHHILAAPLICLSYKVALTVLIWYGYLPNHLVNNVTGRGEAASFPINSASATGPPSSSNGDICVLMIAGQTHHPLGHFAPGYEWNSSLDATISELEANAEEYGFLGATSWLNTCDRTSGSEHMAILYFTSKEMLYAYWRSDGHKKATAYQSRISMKGPWPKGGWSGVRQENYIVRAGEWDNFDSTVKPSGIRGLCHLVTDENGVKSWTGPQILSMRRRKQEAAFPPHTETTAS